ncbi:hypothetical protein HCK01_17045, partial [Streptomyces sp. AA8]|nr:hypothetical protein [Streptomyces telluris]
FWGLLAGVLATVVLNGRRREPAAAREREAGEETGPAERPAGPVSAAEEKAAR